MTDLGTVTVRPAARVRNGVAEILLRVEIPDNVHIEAHEPPEPFLIPTVAEVDGLTDVEAEYPTPRCKDIGLPGAELLVYDGRIEIKLRGKTADAVEALRGRLTYQPCVGGACLLPRTDVWTVDLPKGVALARE
ncbi:MAG: protein-disulfide reductase DsbD domain-containing protein [Actinomycetota bacterium]